MPPTKVNLPFIHVPFLHPFSFGVQNSRFKGIYGSARAEYQGMPNIHTHPTRLATNWYGLQLTKNYLLPLPTYLIVFSFDQVLYTFICIIMLCLKTNVLQQKITYPSASLRLPFTIIYNLILQEKSKEKNLTGNAF